jgi:hypothetical protein
MIPPHLQRIPTHVRYAQLRIVRLDSDNIPSDPAQAFGNFVFQPSSGQQLHSNADAKKRAALPCDSFLKRLGHAAAAFQPPLAIGESAYTRQDDPISAQNDIWVRRN